MVLGKQFLFTPRHMDEQLCPFRQFISQSYLHLLSSPSRYWQFPQSHSEASHHGHGHATCPEKSTSRLGASAGKYDLENMKNPGGQEMSVMAPESCLAAFESFLFLSCFALKLFAKDKDKK